MIDNNSFVPGINSLEQIPENTKERYILNALRAVEDIGNNMGKTDVYTKENLPIFLSEYFEKLREHTECVNKGDIFPKDEIILISFYVERLLKEILRMPRFNRVKVEEYVPLAKVRSWDGKTLNWVAKQPGTTVLEKIGRSDKIRTRVSKTVYDTKENSVVVALLNIILPILNSRIEANSELYKDGVNKGYEELCNYYRNIKRRFINSDLKDVKLKFDNTPNNVLISDRKYSVIYRGYKSLRAYDKKIKEVWNCFLERFTSAVFWKLVASIGVRENVYYEDDLLKIFDENDGLYLKASDQKGGEKVSFFIPVSNDAKVCSKTDRLAVLLAVDPKSRIRKMAGTSEAFGKEGFSRIKVGDIFSVTCEKNGNQYRVTKANKSTGKIKTVKIIISFKGNEITVSCPPFKMVFSLKIHMAKSKGKQGEITESFGLYLDNKRVGKTDYIMDSYGLEQVTQDIFGIVSEKCEISDGVKKKTEEFEVKNGFAMDFTSLCPVLYDENKRQDRTELCKNMGVIATGWEENSKGYFPVKPDMYYSERADFIPVHSIFFERDMKAPFKLSMENLFKNGKLQDGKFFTFSVPDNLDEFGQGPLKSVVENICEHSFPVWRSIGGAISIYPKKRIFKRDEEILVVDLNAESVSATKLKLVQLSDGKERFEHYPCFKESMENENFQREIYAEYLDRVTEEVKLAQWQKDTLIDTGIVQKVISNMRPELYYNGEKFISIDYNANIYKNMIKEQMEKIHEFSKDIISKYYDPRNVKVLVLGSFINIDIFRELISDDRYRNRYFFISEEEVASGVYEISQRLERNEPTWEEYLPDLSLEIIKDGCYGEFPLIEHSKSITAAYGTVNELEIEGNLILAKGKENYKFPLLKQESENRSKLFVAKLEAPCFPLSEDLRVKLKIFYTYGVKNNYRLMVYPADEENRPFDELEVKWESLESDIKFNKMEIPPVSMTPEKVMDVKTEIIAGMINNLKKFKEYYSIIDKILKIAIEKKNTVRTARIKCMESSDLQWEQISKLLKTQLENLYAVYSSKDRSKIENYRKFYSDEKVKKKAGNEQEVLRLFLCALGKWDDLDYFKQKNALRYNDIFCMGHILSGGYDKELAFKLLSQLNNRLKRQYDTKEKVIQALAGIVKYNKDFLESVREERIGRAKVFNLIIKTLKEVFTNISEKLEKRDFKMDDSWRLVEPYRHGCELLVYLLNIEELDFSAEERHRMAKLIKKIDRYIYIYNLQEEYLKHAKIRFKILKGTKDALENMLDISYVVVEQLIGENDSNLIRVEEISEDEGDN